MKSIILLSIVSFLGLVNDANAQTTAPKLTDRGKQGLVSYFRKIVANQQVIVGQQCSETTDVAADYRNYFEAVFEATGKHPALLGLDYGYFAKVDLPAINRHAIDHWKKGGQVTISWHADNPFRPGVGVRAQSFMEEDSMGLLAEQPERRGIRDVHVSR